MADPVAEALAEIKSLLTGSNKPAPKGAKGFDAGSIVIGASLVVIAAVLWHMTRRAPAAGASRVPVAGPRAVPSNPQPGNGAAQPERKVAS